MTDCQNGVEVNRQGKTESALGATMRMFLNRSCLVCAGVGESECVPAVNASKIMGFGKTGGAGKCES